MDPHVLKIVIRFLDQNGTSLFLELSDVSMQKLLAV
jgi:hypothetical protein